MMFWTGAILLLFCAMFLGMSSVDHDELKATRMTHPYYFKCARYNPNSRLYRNCECDPDCTTYRDCCFGAEGKSSAEGLSRSDFECMQTGYFKFKGVYVISRCDEKWSGPVEIKEKCEGPTDFSDLVSAAPATNPAQRITFKNMHCAECNHVEKESLKSFQYELACRGLWQRVPMEEILKHATYNHTTKKWGVNVWLKGVENLTFEECQVIFKVPGYLKDSVRSCHANIVSECAQNWTDLQVRESCHDYTFVVFDSAGGYKNPHCAICNHMSTSRLSRFPRQASSWKTFSFSHHLILDDSTAHRFSFPKLLQVDNPCPEGQQYDPFFKTCRDLKCALPGYVLRNHKCVKGGYENPHCAICNHMSTSRLSRFPRQASRKTPFSFHLILDNSTARRFSFEKLLLVNKPCPEGEHFDPFFKKCRRIRCALPGFVLRNHKCVKGD